MNKIIELEEQIKYHNSLYWDLGTQQISDIAYDNLVRELQKISPNSSVLNELGPTFVNQFGEKVQHDTPMLSLDKTYTDDGIWDWLKKFDGQVVVSPKMDGLAVSLLYNNKGELVCAKTRGNSIYGEDVTANIRLVRDIPNNILPYKNIEVRGEIYLKLSTFEEFKEDYSNPRNLASGGLKQKDPEKSRDYKLSFAAYDLIGLDLQFEVQKFSTLQKMGFPRFEIKLTKRKDIIKAYHWMSKKRDNFDFEIDGVVFKANRIAEHKRLGNTSHHPKYAIAYKFQGEQATTTLNDIDWSVSRTGVITPVAIVEPVNLSGAMIGRATLHNIGILKNLGLLGESIDAKIVIVRSGGVIPKIELVTSYGKSATKIKLPSRCPSCGASTDLRGDFLYCSDPKNCATAEITTIKHFCKVFDIKGFGEKLIKKLHEAKIVKTPLDLFLIDEEQLMVIDRMGERLAKRLILEINNHKRVTLETFLRSLGIPNLGNHASKILVDNFKDIRSILKLKVGDLKGLDSIGPTTAESIAHGLREHFSEIRNLLKYVTLVDKVEVRKKTKFTGKSFVFTGKLEKISRKEARKIIDKLGGKAPSGVKKDLDFLIIGDISKGKSSKQAKAEKYTTTGSKIKILSESQFLSMIKSF
jgi:DNA ligase (NAD+)